MCSMLGTWHDTQRLAPQKFSRQASTIHVSDILALSKSYDFGMHMSPAASLTPINVQQSIEYSTVRVQHHPRLGQACRCNGAYSAHCSLQD